MPNFKAINNQTEITLGNKWVPPSNKFNSQNRLVNAKGNNISCEYNGRKYRIIEKRERTFTALERFARGLLGLIAVICTLCLGLFSKSVRNLFTKSKATVRFAVPQPSTLLAPSTSPPLNYPINLDKRNKTSNAKVREPTKEARNIAATKIQSLFRGYLARSAFKNMKIKHKENLRIQEGEKEAKPLSLKEFKRKLKFFDTYEKDLDTIAKELFKLAPKTLEATELAHLIFEKCYWSKIPILLDAISIAHPSFTLSPFDKIRKAILEDKKHVLNNSALRALLEEHKLEACEETLAACYNLAYSINHPDIYRLSEQAIAAKDYNLNFLWVNLNPQDRIKDTAHNIFGDGLNSFENEVCIKDPEALRVFEENEKSLEKEILENWKEIKKSFSYRISKWADVNPGAEINLWYDSALVTRKAQLQTFKMMRNISKSRGVDIKLRDIRQLSNISGEIENSLHPGTQVYFRVDLLKVLIADHMIGCKDSPKYHVVSDIDVQPMPPQQIFDQRTVDYLSSNGYIFNRVSYMGSFENSFFIFNKENKNLKKVHYETIINQTTFNITSLRQLPRGAEIRPNYVLDSQFIFRQYHDFLRGMKDPYDELACPRKVVKCPNSQFNGGGDFSDSDYQTETFRFIGISNIPYTKNGRNFKKNGVSQIEELIKWKAEPLPSIE